MNIPTIVEEDQIKGYVVVVSPVGYNTLTKVLGTRSGRLFKTEASAQKFAARLERDNPGEAFIVLPVQYDY